MDGAFVSDTEYPMFELRRVRRSCPTYLPWYFYIRSRVLPKTSVEALDSDWRPYAANPAGTRCATGCRSPHLPEQRRIVARIEELAGKIAEAKQLHTHQEEARDNLLVTMAHRADWTDEKTSSSTGWRSVNLGEVLKLSLEPHSVNPETQYPNLGIYSYGRGLFSKPPNQRQRESRRKNLFRVRLDQFIYSKLFQRPKRLVSSARKPALNSSTLL